MRLTFTFFSCILRVFKNALSGQHGLQRRCDISRLKAMIMYFHLSAVSWHIYICVVHLLSEGVPSREDTFLSWHLDPVSEVTRGLTLPF
jgi:hypothetical protein